MEDEGKIGIIALIVAFLAIGIGAVAARDRASENMADNYVVQIIAGTYITIDPENGFGIVTINATGEYSSAVTKIIAGTRIAISPENGWGDVTINVNDNALTWLENHENRIVQIENENYVNRIIAGDNITVSPESGIGEVTVGVLIDNIRPSQLYEAPVGADDGKFPQYDESYDAFSWVTLSRGLVVIADVLIIEACTNIALTDLNLDADKLYVLEMILMNDTGSSNAINIDFNQDTNGDHYYIQWLRATGTTVSSERERRRSLGWGVAPNSCTLMRFDIMKPYEDGVVTMWGGLVQNSPSSIQFIFLSRKWTESTNLTRIDISPTTASTITPGSRIILFTVESG